MSNYNADIRIGVVGQSKLKTLQKDLDKINASVNKLNKALVLKARDQTIKLNTKGAAAQLRLLENQLNKLGRVITVKVRTNEEKGKASSSSTVIASGSNQSAAIGLASLKRQSALQKEITNQSKSESAAAEVTERIRNQIEQTDRAILKTREEQARLNKSLPEQRGNRKLSFKDQIQQLSDAGQISKKVSGDFDKLKTRLADLGPGDAGKEYKRFFDGISDGTKRLTAAQGQAEEAARTGIQKQISERQRLETRKQQLLKRGEAAEVAGVNRTTEAIKNELKEREAAEIAYEQRRQRRIERVQLRDRLRERKKTGENLKKGALGAGGVAASSALSGVPGLGGLATGGTVGYFTGGVPGAVGGALAGAAVEGTAALAALGKQAAVTRAEFDKLQISLELAAGDDFADSVKTIQRVVDDFNAPLVDTTEQFTKLYAASQGSGIAFSELEDLFIGLSAANKAYAGDSEDLNGILRAFTQIISKGTVQSEELKGQVGERLPGAFKKAADSLGLTTAQLQKALEQGEIQSADFVKKFGKYMLQYEEDAKIIAKSPAEAGARLKTAMDKLLVKLGPVFAAMGAAFQDFATFAINSLIPLANFVNELFAKISQAPIAIATAQRNEALEEFRRADKDDWDYDLREKNLAKAVENLNGKLAERDSLEAALERRSKRKAAGTIDPTTLEDPKTGGGSKGPDRAKLAADMLEDQRRQLELLNAETDLEKTLLQIEYDRMDALKDIKEIEASKQPAAIKNAEDLAKAESGTAIGEALAADAQDLINKEKERKAALDEILIPLKEQERLLQARLNGNEKEVEIDLIIEDAKRRIKDIDAEALRTQLEKNNALEKQNELVAQQEQFWGSINRTIGDGLQRGIEGLIKGTESLNDVLSDVLGQLGSMFINAGISGLAGPGGAFGAKGLPGYRAEGGPISAGSPYIVGEEGPELVIPQSSGTVIPNDAFDAATAALSRGGGGGSTESNDAAFAAASTAVQEKMSIMRQGQEQAINNPQPIDVRYQATVINNETYVTAQQFQAGMSKTANQARAQTLKDLRNKPAARSRAGVS